MIRRAFRRVMAAIAVRRIARSLRKDARRHYGRAGAVDYLEGHRLALRRTQGRIPMIARAVDLAIRSERARTFYRLHRRSGEPA